MRRQFFGEVTNWKPSTCGLAIDVPQAELGPEPPVRLHDDLAGDQGLGLDRAPVAEGGLLIEIADLLDIGLGRQRAEKPGTIEIGGDDRGDVGAELALVGGRPDEARYGDRQRLDLPLGDVELDCRTGRW